MAEESGNLLVTPERTKPNEGNTRRSSMGKANSLTSGEKVLPHYLRASTGSCHDFCKYGRKHASEAKERRPLQQRITKSAPDSQSPTVTVIVPERKKTSVVRPNFSPVSKSSFDIPEAEIIKREVCTKSSDNQNAKESLYDQNSVMGEAQSRMKKKSAAKLRSPKSETRLSESPKFKQEDLLPSSEKVNASSSKFSQKSEETNTSAKDAISMKLKYPGMKPLPSPDHSEGLSSRRNSDIGKKMAHPKIAEKQAPASHRLSLASPRESLSPKPSVIRVASLNSRKFKSLKVVSPLKNHCKGKNAKTEQSKNGRKQDNNDSVHEYMKLKSPAMKPLRLPDHSEGLSSRRNSGINSGEKMEHPKIAVKKAPTSHRLSLASPRASLSPRPSIVRVASPNSRKLKNLKAVSPLKNQGKVKSAGTVQSKIEMKQADNDSVQERTLYIIKMESESKSLEYDQNESCDAESSLSPSSLLPKCIPSSPLSLLQNEEDEQSEYTETEAEDDYFSEPEYDESMAMEGEESLGCERRGEHKNNGMVHSEDKESRAMKLNFRRGKIFNIQSESNSSRRLKFRRGRVLDQNQNLKADGRRSFKKRGVDDEMNDSKPGSEKVVLRHQDVQGKKDSRVLFNNVIEQTASKLVETRKSKVKALVGAFETVISLQESKPSTNITT